MRKVLQHFTRIVEGKKMLQRFLKMPGHFQFNSYEVGWWKNKKNII
jgi:hypothetical protein